MNPSDYGPYRATALWNEAVLLFKAGMPLKENRHRLHKHKQSFTGRSGITFLQKSLLANQLFNANVTRKQAHQLLNHFLTAGLIRPVKDCSIRSQEGLQDSSKYLYEFTEALINFQIKLPASLSLTKLHAMSTYDNENHSNNLIKSRHPIGFQESEDERWKNEIIRRIEKMLKLFEINIAVQDLLPCSVIEAKWVITNASPDWNKIKWNTELPHWILAAIHDLLSCASPEKKTTTYPHFEVEILKIIVDYFDTLEQSLILPSFYKFLCTVFIELNFVNEQNKTNAITSRSQENLILDMSCNQNDISEADNCNNKFLPPNSCYEAAFISDKPVTRIVPQSSFDIIHLKQSPKQHTYNLFDLKPNPLRASSSLQDIKDEKVMPGNKLISGSKRRPLHVKSENILDSNKGLNNFTINKSCKSLSQLSKNEGIDNEGFRIGSPVQQKKHQNVPNIHSKNFDKRNMYFCTDKRKSRSHDELDQFAYVNHGLNFSLEESFETENTLDYLFAIETVNKLVKVTQSKRTSVSSDELSFHSAYSHSDSELFQTMSPEHFDQERDNKVGQHIQWSEPVMKLGISLCQFVLMLLPPNNRAQLKLLLILMNHIKENPRFNKDKSFIEMLKKVRNSILTSEEKILYDQKQVDEIISFLAIHCDMVFSELHWEVISSIKSKVDCQNSQKTSFCERISSGKFMEQKSMQSCMALSELLEQIMQDVNLSKKDQKKYIKMFKECYPGIYSQHCTQLAQSSTKKTNLRV